MGEYDNPYKISQRQLICNLCSKDKKKDEEVKILYLEHESGATKSFVKFFKKKKV